MENPANPQSQDSEPQPGRPVFDALHDALRRGAEDARTAAEMTIPKVKSAAADAVYWTAYGASYAAVFQWTFVKGLAPESLKSGCRDGVKAAEEAARRWTDKLRQRKEKATDASPDPTGPSPEAVQPGAA